MKILIFAHDCGLRGAERVVADHAQALMSRGWTVAVVVPCLDGGLADSLKEKNIRYLRVRYFGWIGPGRFKGRILRTLYNLIALPQLLFLVRSFRPDVIHIHTIACGVGGVVARLADVPRVWQLHETGPYGISSDRAFFDLGFSLSPRVMRWTKCRFVAVSSEIANLYRRKLGLSEIGVLYQAVCLDQTAVLADTPALARLSSWPGRKLVIVGSIVPLKDQMTAVRALPGILRDWPDTGLFLVGDDPLGLGNEIDTLARTLGVADNVMRLGTLANAAPAIAAADCCIVTAIDEGFGRVAVEAMLCATPVVAADVAINREVAGGSNADFFEPSDPESLASVLSVQFSRTADEQHLRAGRALAYAQSHFGEEAAMNALEIELRAEIARRDGAPCHIKSDYCE